MVDRGDVVEGGAESESGEGHPTVDSRIDGQHDLVGNPLLVGDVPDTGCEADAEVDDRLGRQLHGRPAQYDFLLVQRQWRQGLEGDTNLAREGGMVLVVVCLHVHLGLGDDDTVDHRARNADVTGIDRVQLRNPFDLADDHAARVARRHRERQVFEAQRFFFEGDIPIGVCGRSADEGHIHREGGEVEHFLPVEIEQ